MKHTCVIIDDESHSISVLSALIKKEGNLDLLFGEKNPIEAIKQLGKMPKAPDIIFCDIDMPKITGTDLAPMFADKSVFVFTTAYSQYAVQGYKMNVSYYLMKPIGPQDFQECLAHCRRRIREKQLFYTVQPEDDKYFFLKGAERGAKQKMIKDEILFIRSVGNYLRFTRLNNEVDSYLTFGDALKKLGEQKFIRANKSYLVNLDHVAGIKGGKVIMKGHDEDIPLTVGFREAFLQKIEHMVMSSTRS